MSTFKEISIPVPWGQIAVKAWNEPSGQPVLLAHGLLDNAGGFDRLVSLLPKNLYLVAVDLPGHGKSSPVYPSVTLKYTDVVIGIQHVVNHFKWDKFAYVGHSAGAYVGFWYSVFFPDKVSKLVALDEPIPVFTADRGAEMLHLSFQLLKESLDLKPATFTHSAAIQRILGLHPDGLTVGSAHLLAERMLERHGDGSYRFRMDHRAKQPEINPMNAEQAVEYMKRIKCPILQIAASESLANGLFNDAFFRRSYTDSEPIRRMFETNLKDKYRFQVVEGNHNVYMDYPERLSDLVADFLAEQYSTDF